jgi:hypothetical protein
MPVPGPTFDYRRRLHGQYVRQSDYVHEGRLDRLLSELAESEIAGLQDRTTVMPDVPPFPVIRHLDALIEAARASPDFKLVRTIPLTGGNYYVFAKRPALYVRFGPGWGPSEGPYPQWKLGIARWSSQRSDMSVAGAGAGHLYFTCRLTAGAHATLTTPGGTVMLPGTGHSEKVSIPVKSGDTLTIKVEGADHSDRALLCQEPVFGW